jgi:glycosyltransferase involved in cell wall biosynthesis
MSEPLRVATVITRLDGGAGVLALRGALALDPAEFRIVLITGLVPDSGDRLLDEAKAEGLEVIMEPALVAPIDPRHDAAALRSLSALLRQRPFDVVHTHTAKAGVLGRISAKRAAVPRVVHTYHGFPFHEFQSPLRRAGYVAVERRLGQLTDVALCVGTGVAVEAIRRGLVPPERIRTIGVVVPDGMSPAPGARDRARQMLGVPPDAIVVGAVGRLTYQKAPEDFLAAMRELGRLRQAGRSGGLGGQHRSDLVGVWVGDGELAERIGRLASSAPGPKVVLAGDRVDVPEILPAFDVFALPSRYEGLPTVVVEAMMCGIPVVATAVNAVGDVVVPGETGLLVPPQRPDLLAEAVNYLLDSPDAAARMAVAARERLGTRFSAATLRASLMAAYRGPAMTRISPPGGQ